MGYCCFPPCCMCEADPVILPPEFLDPRAKGSPETQKFLASHWNWILIVPQEENKTATYGLQGLQSILPPRLFLTIVPLQVTSQQHLFLIFIFTCHAQHGCMESDLSLWPLCYRIRPWHFLLRGAALQRHKVKNGEGIFGVLTCHSPVKETEN